MSILKKKKHQQRNDFKSNSEYQPTVSFEEIMQVLQRAM